MSWCVTLWSAGRSARKRMREKQERKRVFRSLSRWWSSFKVTPHSYLKLVVLFVQRRCLDSLSLPSSMKSHTYAATLSRAYLTHTLTLTQRHTHTHTLASVYEAQCVLTGPGTVLNPPVHFHASRQHQIRDCVFIGPQEVVVWHNHTVETHTSVCVFHLTDAF